MNNARFLLWDLPTRLFHWLLVVSVVAAVVSGQLGGGLIEWDGRMGIFIAGLLVFRIVWGIVGSTYARFAQFFPSPATIRAYLAGQWHGEGHNPLGALSVLALILLLTAQVVTGLFANDDIAFTGPLYALIDADLSGRLTGLHHLFADGVIGLVGLHVVAIAFYIRFRKQNLLMPMLTGWKEGNPQASARGGRWLALLLAMALAAGAIYGASGAWLPLPPPPAAVETPSW